MNVDKLITAIRTDDKDVATGMFANIRPEDYTSDIEELHHRVCEWAILIYKKPPTGILLAISGMLFIMGIAGMCSTYLLDAAAAGFCLVIGFILLTFTFIRHTNWKHDGVEVERMRQSLIDSIKKMSNELYELKEMPRPKSLTSVHFPLEYDEEDVASYDKMPKSPDNILVSATMHSHEEAEPHLTDVGASLPDIVNAPLPKVRNAHAIGSVLYVMDLNDSEVVYRMPSDEEAKQVVDKLSAGMDVDLSIYDKLS